MENAEVVATLALAGVPGIGTGRLRFLVSTFGSAADALAAPHARLAGLRGVGPAAATAIKTASPADGQRVLERLAALGAGSGRPARALLPGDPDFPEQLAEIHDPPAVLYVWGDVALLRRPAVAMVGSRNHTPYGAEAVRLLAAAVARRDVVVVSGMARGIDALAHAAALDAGGPSAGVLGNGFGVVYPAANRALYERMVARGVLVTEHPPGERPHAGSFSRRNRLIAGLARAVVVIEAAPGSGAIVTADAGLGQGRAVLAVPGPITSPTSVGCNQLIQQGAKAALCAADILEEIGLPRGLAETALALATPAPRVPPPDLSGLQLALWSRLTAEPQHVDALVGAAGTGAASVLGALTELELRGLVRQGPGMVFGLT